MQKKRLCTRTRHGGDDFLPDQAGFADTGNDHPPFAGEDHIHGARKVCVDLFDQMQKALCFSHKNFFSSFDGTCESLSHENSFFIPLLTIFREASRKKQTKQQRFDSGKERGLVFDIDG